MTTEPPNHDYKAIWRDQPTESVNMSVADIRVKAQRFQSRSRLVLMINYFNAALITVLFGWGVATSPNWITKLGCGAGMLLGLSFGWWAHQRRPGRMPAAQGAGLAVLEFHRRELERAKVKFKTMLLFVLPLVVSFGLITAGADVMRPGMSSLKGPAPIAVLIAAWILVAWLRQRGYARRIQRQIDELDAVRRE